MKLIDKPLTEKQRKFAELYVQEFGRLSATECAINAGYSKDSAYQRAHELLNNKTVDTGQLAQMLANRHDLTILDSLKDALRFSCDTYQLALQLD